MITDDLREFGELALQTAYFIHCDRDVALGVVKEALDALKLSLAKQEKGRYYHPKGQRPHDPKTGEPLDALPPRRSKPFLPEPIMLQRLVFIFSESIERRQEESDDFTGLHGEDFLIRYLKHLVRITMRRSSSYVTIGISSLLYNYKAPEINKIYCLVCQDIDGGKEDASLRDKKGTLKKELTGRFGSALKFDSPHPELARFASLVTAYLDFFNLWKWPCVLTEWRGSFTDPIEQLTFQGGNPDDESDIELNRFHCIIHSRDYKRLIEAVGLDHPGQRLMVPHYQRSENMNNNSGNGSGGPSVDRSTAKMNDEEWRDLKSYLDEQNARRKAVSASTFFIEVNGVECAHINLDSVRTVGFQVDEIAELIEVKTRLPQGDLRMATLLLDQSDLDDERNLQLYEVALPGDRKLQFNIAPTRDEFGEIAGAKIDLSYQEASLPELSYQEASVPETATVFKRQVPISTIERVITPILRLIGFKEGRGDTSSPGHSDRVEPASGLITTRRRHPLATVAYVTAGLIIVMTTWLMWQASRLSTQNELLLKENARLTEDAKQAASREAHTQQLLSDALKKLEEGAIRPHNNRDKNIVLALNDGKGQVTLDAQGNIAGLPSLSPTHRQMVREALTAQQVKEPSEIKDLKSTAGALIGPRGDDSFPLLSPVGTVVQSNLPTFRWRPHDGATSYTVIISDSQYEVVTTSPLLSGTEWTVGSSLKGGTMYLWQVIARIDGKDVKLPGPPLVGAKFQVLEHGKAARLEREKRIYAGSHLMLGLLYTQAGLLDDAEREFDALLAGNPQSPVAQKLQLQLRALRRAPR